MLTHRERRFLEDVGFTILDNLAGITVSTFLHGTFLLLLFLSTSTLFRQRAKSLSTLVMFGTTIMSFLLASLYWTAYISFFARYIRKALIDSIHTSLNGARLDDINESNFKVDQITIWTRQVLQIMGDAIVVWRAWALCTRRRWVMLGPVVLFLGTCATSFAFLGLTSTHSQYEAYIDGEVVTSALYNAAGSLSLATNGVATISIAFMLWSHRKSWNTGIGSRWSRAQSILLMIIESGAIYGAFQLTTVIVLNELYDDNTPMVYFVGFIYESYVMTTAMYPVVVLLLINQKRSFTNLRSFASIPQSEAMYSRRSTVQVTHASGSSGEDTMGSIPLTTLRENETNHPPSPL